VLSYNYTVFPSFLLSFAEINNRKAVDTTGFISVGWMCIVRWMLRVPVTMKTQFVDGQKYYNFSDTFNVVTVANQLHNCISTFFPSDILCLNFAHCMIAASHLCALSCWENPLLTPKAVFQLQNPTRAKTGSWSRTLYLYLFFREDDAVVGWLQAPFFLETYSAGPSAIPKLTSKVIEKSMRLLWVSRNQ